MQPGGKFHTAQDTGGHNSPDDRGQSRHGSEGIGKRVSCSNATDAGVSRDAGGEESSHGHPDDGDLQLL